MYSEEIDGKVLEHWTPEDVRIAFENNEIVLIDVRSPQEFMTETIEGALLAPIQTLVPEKLPTQDGKRIVLYCGVGGRSHRAAKMSLESGLDRIAHMDGGFRAWKQDGLPYIGIEPGTGAPRRMP